MELTVPIIGGELRGAWWLPAAGGKLLRVLMGSYEPDQTQRFVERIRPGDTVLDVGAHVGYYTLLASRLVGLEGRVVAFEPNPRNARFLRSHVRVNRRSNVEVRQQAVAERAGMARFEFGSGSGTGHLAQAGELEVEVVALDPWLAEAGLRPTAMKVDVEGAEMAVLRGARGTLERDRPELFLSTHGPTPHRDCIAFLRDLGYEIFPIQHDSIERDSELLCVHPDAPTR